jgi:hypothetical protein
MNKLQWLALVNKLSLHVFGVSIEVVYTNIYECEDYLDHLLNDFNCGLTPGDIIQDICENMPEYNVFEKIERKNNQELEAEL